MAVYYYKGSQIVTPFTIYSNEPHFDTETVSLRILRGSQGHQRWDLNFTTVNSADNEVEAMLGAITNLQSADTMIMPQLPSVANSNTLTANPVVGVTAAVGDTSVTIDGTSSAGVLPKGTFFKFSGHSKIYVVTEALDMSGSSNQTLNFYPALRDTVVALETLRTGDDAILRFYRDVNNVQGIQFRDGVLSDAGSITLLEALI